MHSKYIIDTHTHIGYWPTLTKTINNLVKDNLNHNISFALVSFDGSEFKENNQSKLINQIEGSKKTLNFINKHHGYGELIWVRPNKERNFKEIDEFINKNRTKIYGIKFHPACSHLKVTNNKLIPYFKICEKYDLPFVCHTALDEYSSIIYLQKVAIKYPNIKFIAAHMELLSDHKFTIERMKETLNLYCDTAWVDPSITKIIIKNKLIDRFIFGTDDPIDGVCTLDNPIYVNYMNNKMRISKKNFEKIMYKNAMYIFKIKEDSLLK